MSSKLLTPQAAQELLAQGAVLVDIRGADEYAREHIASAHHIPMEQLSSQGMPSNEANAVIFHCNSGNRTVMNAGVLDNCATCEVYILEGGLDGWKKAGLPFLYRVTFAMQFLYFKAPALQAIPPLVFLLLHRGCRLCSHPVACSARDDKQLRPTPKPPASAVFFLATAV